MRAYYSEIDPYAAQWLRNLIEAGHIAPGDVDERDIREVEPDDLRGYVQGVSADLEEEGYAVGSVVLGAHSVGAPHIRQRLWFVAERLARSDGSGLSRRGIGTVQPESGAASRERHGAGGVADASRPERRDAEQPREGTGAARAGTSTESGRFGEGLEGHAGNGDDRDEPGRDHSEPNRSASPAGNARRVGDAAGIGRLEECADTGGREEGSGPQGREQRPWDDSGLIPCADGKARRVEPGIFPLAHGATVRVGRLRAYGNAIVPQVAAEFIRAYRDVRGIGGRL